MTRKDRTHRSFETSWGVNFEDGSARFRLWDAGGADVKLRIQGRDVPMKKAGDGWAEARLENIKPGTPYCYRLPDGREVPDPASRAQLSDVHGPSLVVDPHAYRWRHPGYKARAWEEIVYYELHVGTFTPEGTFRAAIAKLPHLRDLGITAIELMPVGQWEGKRGWGYDGVLMYAPHAAYGTPDDLKALVDAAHGHGINVVLDVIYNHFGPAGNYIPLYAPHFFHPERHTPWGAAIAYEEKPVRDFFIENAIYWLEEFHLDGLRLDAIDHILDDQSHTNIIVEIAQRVRDAIPDRAIHLTTEDNRNITHLHERGADGRAQLYDAEWNDDLHNVAHALATGETEGYYCDFVEKHYYKLARSLAEGFAFQGEPYLMRGGEPRGERSAHLPPTAFVDFLQNHDQVGNRAFGERLITLCEARTLSMFTAMLLLSPHIPLLFMGEEWGETRPFSFFTDFHGELADAVREGRRREFAAFSAFHGDAAILRQIPDPNAETTFAASKLDWSGIETAHGRHWLSFYTALLKIRAERVVPMLRDAPRNSGKFTASDDGVIWVEWTLNSGTLRMVLNLSVETRNAPAMSGTTIYTNIDDLPGDLSTIAELPGHSIIVAAEERRRPAA